METDDLILIDTAIFEESYQGALKKFKSTNKAHARNTIFHVLKQKKAGDRRMSHVLASEYLTSLGIQEEKRKGIQSTVTRYFNKKAKLRKARNKNTPPLSPWAEVFALCQAERPGIDRATNEDVIDPDGVDRNYLPCTE